MENKIIESLKDYLRENKDLACYIYIEDGKEKIITNGDLELLIGGLQLANQLNWCEINRYKNLCDSLRGELAKKIRQSEESEIKELRERIEKLEKALIDMISQFCTIIKGNEEFLGYDDLSAVDEAYDLLDIEGGQKMDDVFKKYFKIWGREYY